MLALLLVGLQLALLAYFVFFAFFNYLYAIGSFFYKRPEEVEPSGKRVAIVIVSFNEKEVLMSTIKACEEIDYPKKTIIIGDDSKDEETYKMLVKWIKSKGGRKVPQHHIDRHHTPSDVWQTKDQQYVIFHRHDNNGFKAGNLKEVNEYMKRKRIEYMYLLDSDWLPEKDVLTKAMSVLEADHELAFVQTRRDHYNRLSGPFQHAASLSEEAEYSVDLVGRHALNHPILFTGCCTLFRLDAVLDVGGFRPGQLTEDIDLTNRLYLGGWQAAYIPYAGNAGEVAPTYRSLIKQQERWAQGTAVTLKESLKNIFVYKNFTFLQAMSLIRQNMYYSTAIAIELSIFLAILSVVWIGVFRESYNANLYLLYMQQIYTPFVILLFASLLSNFFPLMLSIIRNKHYKEIPFMFFSSWLYWSLLHTYFWANIKGFLGVKSNWFKTPKTSGKKIVDKTTRSKKLLLINVITLFVFLFIYGTEWFLFGYIDPYAFFWIPAMTVAIFVT